MVDRRPVRFDLPAMAARAAPARAARRRGRTAETARADLARPARSERARLGGVGRAPPVANGDAAAGWAAGPPDFRAVEDGRLRRGREAAGGPRGRRAPGRQGAAWP